MHKEPQGGPAALNTNTSEQKAHSPFGASPSKRWLSCPGSIALCEKAPEQPESPFAKEGTDAHACFEFLLRNRENIGKARREALKTWPKEMVDHGSAAAAYVLTRLQEYPGASLLIETRVDASAFTAPDNWGTVDVAIVHHYGRLLVMDFKYGAGVAVEPAEDGKANSQLAYYALGISHKYDHDFSDVELVVIQPRAYHPSGETIRSHVMSIDELEEWHMVFRAGVRAAAKVDAPLVPGDHCRWCRAKVICPKLKGDGFAKTGTALVESTGVVSLPAPKMVPLENLGTILDGCDRLEEWIGAVRSHAYSVLEMGAPVAGWKLVDKRASRKWKSEAEAEEVFSELIPDALAFDELFTDPKIKTPAQVEQALILEGWSKAQVREVFETLVHSVSSGRTMVRETDKRGAVAGRSDPKNVFSPIRPDQIEI